MGKGERVRTEPCHLLLFSPSAVSQSLLRLRSTSGGKKQARDPNSHSGGREKDGRRKAYLQFYNWYYQLPQRGGGRSSLGRREEEHEVGQQQQQSLFFLAEPVGRRSKLLPAARRRPCGGDSLHLSLSSPEVSEQQKKEGSQGGERTAPMGVVRSVGEKRAFPHASFGGLVGPPRGRRCCCFQQRRGGGGGGGGTNIC